MEDFYKRWKIIEKLDYKEEFIKFKTRVLTIFSDIDKHVEEAVVEDFCNRLGVLPTWYYDNFSYRNIGENIINTLKNIHDEKKFYFVLELVLNLNIQTLWGFNRNIEYSRDILILKFFKILKYSNVNLKAVKKNKEIILYPKGEEILDDKLVDRVLSFLDDKSQKHFIEALKLYEKKTEKDSIKSAESLRRSLEEFLRFKLSNSKGLQGNILELQKKLKINGCDIKIRNIISKIFTYLDQYFNENSKHNDGDINESENEFLIYQIGLLMRYINLNIN